MTGASTYSYPRAAVTVDCVVFGYDGEGMKVLLMQRDDEPFKGSWALPGRYVRYEETLDEAAENTLSDKVGITGVFLEQLYTFGEIGRDPRERVISIAYFALVSPANHVVSPHSNARAVAWFKVAELPVLAFDHHNIVQTAIMRLRGKVRYQPIGFELLPEKFTLTELQQLYETILCQTLDKRNFRKKILGMGFLKELDEVKAHLKHRAPRLYSFDSTKYDLLVKKGINFEI